MIVDTSALLAIIMGEAPREACLAALEKAGRLAISAATLAECLVVAIGKDVEKEMRELLDALDADVLPVTADVAYAVGEARRRWGKGKHPAGLNYGDCFSYVTAKQAGLPLLYVGNDFAKTDVAAAVTTG